MSKANIILIFFVAIVITAGTYWYTAQTKQTHIACTMEAKLCPDGSYVGRTGPNCEFTTCPGTTPAASIGTNGIPSGGSGVRGTVMLGPTCPVERITPDPNCADRPYQTSVKVFRASDSVHAFVVTQSDTKGTFAVSMPPGEYTLVAGESSLTRCNHLQVTVRPKIVVSTIISCDTGIR